MTISITPEMLAALRESGGIFAGLEAIQIRDADQRYVLTIPQILDALEELMRRREAARVSGSGENPIAVGMLVKVARLGSTEGFLIAPKHMTCRRLGARGFVKSYVPGHGGDVWFVSHHDDANIGAYSVMELEPV